MFKLLIRSLTLICSIVLVVTAFAQNLDANERVVRGPVVASYINHATGAPSGAFFVISVNDTNELLVLEHFFERPVNPFGPLTAKIHKAFAQGDKDVELEVKINEDEIYRRMQMAPFIKEMLRTRIGGNFNINVFLHGDLTREDIRNLRFVPVGTSEWSEYFPKIPACADAF